MGKMAFGIVNVEKFSLVLNFNSEPDGVSNDRFCKHNRQC